MHSGIAWTIIGISILAIAGLMSLPWLWRHRKPTVLPPSPVLPLTFSGSRFIAIFNSIFAIPAAASGWFGLVDTLFIERGFGHPWLLLPLVLGTIFSSFLAWIFGVAAIFPDRMVLSDGGIWCRVGGRIRQWSWDQVRNARAGVRGPLILELWQDDPGRAKWLRRLHSKADARLMPLGFLWKLSGFPWSGEETVATAIRAILAVRDGQGAVICVKVK